MSKLYYMNRMAYGASSGDLLGLAAKGIKGLFGLFKKKKITQVVQTALPAAKKMANVVLPGVAAGAGWALGESAISGGGGGGASGGWVRRRARGITARELRGYRKVANLLHKEGMVSRRARGRK